MTKPAVTSTRAYFFTGKATIWAVMVVPMSAPKMTPMAWDRDIMPAVTNPTSITVVTDEDWITAVMLAPVRSPETRLLVRRPRISFMRFPATAFKASDIWSMPKRKNGQSAEHLHAHDPPCYLLSTDV